VTDLGWIEIAKVERPGGIIRVFQDDETGRVKVETLVSMYYDQMLKLDLEKELRKEQMNAKYYEFFDDFGKAIKWIEERGFRNNLDFTYFGGPKRGTR
jgi:hypothetical protein